MRLFWPPMRGKGAAGARQGRGSATRDEAIAASHVAAQFESCGLKPRPA